ncbi:MAG: hypothetical protein AAF495_04425 [Pseudomonadota bacterium]
MIVALGDIAILEKALHRLRRFGMGFLVFLFSFWFVKYAMTELYALGSKPFLGSITAGVFYGLIEGLLSVLTCRFILTKSMDGRLADATTMVVAVVTLLIHGGGSLVSLAIGRFPENPAVLLPTFAVWTPWVIWAAIVGSARFSRRPAP